MKKYKNRVLVYSVIETMVSLSKDRLFEFYDGVKNLGIKFNNERTQEVEISPIINICREFSYNHKERFTKKEFEENYNCGDKDWGALKDILASNIEGDKMFHYEMSYELSFFRNKDELVYNPGFEDMEHHDFLDYKNEDRSFTDKFYYRGCPIWESIQPKRQHKWSGIPEWGENFPKWKKWLKNNDYDEEVQADALKLGKMSAILALRHNEDLPTDSEIGAIELTDEDLNEWKEHREKQEQSFQQNMKNFYKKNLDTWQQKEKMKKESENEQ